MLSGSDREVSDLSYNLLNTADMNVLKAIADEFVSMELSPVKRSVAKETLNRIEKFLNAIHSGACRCEKYSICTYPVYSEQKREMIKILSVNNDPLTQDCDVLCSCTLCGALFSVHEYDAGFGRKFDWSKKI